jgi:hypothetical protein
MTFFKNSSVLALMIAIFLVSCGGTPKADKVLQGEWSISQLNLAGNELDKEMLEGSYMRFGEAGKFEENMVGDSHAGNFKINPEGSGFSVTYDGEEGEGEHYTISSITAEKITLEGESHGMKRTLTLEKAKK